VLRELGFGDQTAIDSVKPSRGDLMLRKQCLHGFTPLSGGGKIDDKTG
jgi:hypothetical protein